MTKQKQRSSIKDTGWYKDGKKDAGKDKCDVYDNLYVHMELRRGDRLIDTRVETRDLDRVRCIKDENRMVLVKEEVKEKWGLYFVDLLNLEYENEVNDNLQPNKGVVIKISRLGMK